MPLKIQKVPPYWEHPLDAQGRPVPMPIDKTFAEAAADWKKSFMEWESNPEQKSKYPGTEFWELEPPPDPEECRPWADHEATWFQVWHTDGAPATPAYPSKDELIDYLTENRWDDNGREKVSWSRESAKRFVEKGFSLPMIGGGKVSYSHDEEA